jgi:hypothetical protein
LLVLDASAIIRTVYQFCHGLVSVSLTHKGLAS